MVGLRPEGDRWEYRKGPLLNAIQGGKKQVVLEEINRTEFSQAIGEVFSLLEESYRGEDHSIRLRSGENFYIPADVLVICTMNTLDRSTEDIDDALFGRMAAIEFPPRVEDLHEMLDANAISSDVSDKLRQLFATILSVYQLGHGYFNGIKPNSNFLEYYITRIRPVLQKHLQNYKDDDLKMIDEKVNQLFN
jgi:5-methylcytosine-specific restriction enzyme B